MKRISQVLRRHYIAYIHSCLADLCLILQQVKFSRSSAVRPRKEQRPLASFFQLFLIIHAPLSQRVLGVSESNTEMRDPVLMFISLVLKSHRHSNFQRYKEEQSQHLGPWTQYTYNENRQVTEKGKDRSKEQVIEYYCVTYLS